MIKYLPSICKMGLNYLQFKTNKSRVHLQSIDMILDHVHVKPLHFSSLTPLPFYPYYALFSQVILLLARECIVLSLFS